MSVLLCVICRSMDASCYMLLIVLRYQYLGIAFKRGGGAGM